METEGGLTVAQEWRREGEGCGEVESDHWYPRGFFLGLSKRFKIECQAGHAILQIYQKPFNCTF